MFCGDPRRDTATLHMKSSSGRCCSSNQQRWPNKIHRLQQDGQGLSEGPDSFGAGRWTWMYFKRVASCAVSRSSGCPLRHAVMVNGPVKMNAASSSYTNSPRDESVFATPIKVGNPSSSLFKVHTTMRRPCYSLRWLPGLYRNYCHTNNSWPRMFWIGQK